MPEENTYLKGLIKHFEKIKEAHPEDIFKSLYSLRGISVKDKIALATACLNDGRAMLMRRNGPLSRTLVILNLIHRLEKSVARSKRS